MVSASTLPLQPMADKGSKEDQCRRGKAPGTGAHVVDCAGKGGNCCQLGDMVSIRSSIV